MDVLVTGGTGFVGACTVARLLDAGHRVRLLVRRPEQVETSLRPWGHGRDDLAGVVVGDGSDVGGGASIMGTLSGGGKAVISVGERCLLGANAGIGISLGDDCVVEAGCYVTAGTKVTVLDRDGGSQVVKAAELSGSSNVLFRRNSTTGAVEAVPWKGQGIELNADLHAN